VVGGGEGSSIEVMWWTYPLPWPISGMILTNS
jgi:hypothetical protein